MPAISACYFLLHKFMIVDRMSWIKLCALTFIMLESCLAYHLEYEGKIRIEKLIIKDHLTNCPPDDPAPVPDHPGGQLEGLELPLPSLSLHLWGRTLLLPPQCRQVS